MAAGPVTIPADNLELFFDGTIDFDAHDIKVALFASAYSTATRFYATANEVATGNGYTQGGQTLAGKSVSETTGTVALDADDVSWTADGGSITARYGVIYDDTASGKPILGYFLLDDTPADVTVTNGNDLGIVWNAAGIITAVRA